MFDAMGVFQHHDAITGTDSQFVDQDYVLHLWRAMQENKRVTTGLLQDALYRYTGIKAKDGSLESCIGSGNDTVV